MDVHTQLRHAIAQLESRNVLGPAGEEELRLLRERLHDLSRSPEDLAQRDETRRLWTESRRAWAERRGAHYEAWQDWRRSQGAGSRLP